MKRFAFVAVASVFLSAIGVRAQTALVTATVAPRINPKPAHVRVSPKPTVVPVRVSPKPSVVPRRVIPRTVVAAKTTPTATNHNIAPNSNMPGGKYAEALRRFHHERHDCNWWKQHYTVIVLVGGGYYYWDAGYWYPAWGYNPSYESYDYDGPIYTYGNLLPDQVIVNVQRALKDLGYYDGQTTGALTPLTRRAISLFQNDNGLEVNGVVDEDTVHALGLY